MIFTFIYGLLAFIFISLVALSYKLPELISLQTKVDNETDEENLHASQNYVYIAIVLVILAAIANTYFAVKGSPWEAHLMEWLN
ncbi:MAG: hypothetical protein WAU01_02345, partial [Saprospiraceae bacterium]